MDCKSTRLIVAEPQCKAEARLPSESVVTRCQRCRGTGQEVIVNFFSPELAQDVSIPCRSCSGKGFVLESDHEEKVGPPTLDDQVTY